MSKALTPLFDLKSQYQALKPQIQERINRVLEHGQYILGPEVRELEEKLEQYTGAKHCITVASGTEALLISLMALGIKTGDEVITTPFTYIATVEVIVRLGAKPVFIDINAKTLNIEEKLIEKSITKNTKAIIAVSLFGQPSNMEEINRIASKYSEITVIEDAAQSFGSSYKGKKSCNLSAIGCTSFFPSKPLGCYGDGGAIITSNDELAEICREIRVHGQVEKYVHKRVGVGGRMDTLQCAIVLAKLDYFEKEVCRRIEIGEYYSNMLDKVGIRHQLIKSDVKSVYGQYTVLLNNRNKVQELLNKNLIPTAIHYPIPITDQEPYKKYSFDQYPVSREASKKVLSLPMHVYLTKKNQEDIVKLIEKGEYGSI